MSTKRHLINSLADIFTVAAVLLLISALVILIMRFTDRPIKNITIIGEVKYSNNNTLERALRVSQQGNFFSVDIERLRQELETVAWIKQVDIRRIWPDKLAININEQKPIARWRDAIDNEETGENIKYVNNDGEIFNVPQQINELNKLPSFIGPASSAPDMLRRYQQISQQLRNLRTKIVKVELSPRLAWSLQLENGLRIELGREHERVSHDRVLTRFVDIYPQLQAVRAEVPKVADLRYPNGFVLSYNKQTVPVEINN